MPPAGVFDAAWVANVHEANWPGHPVLNPFISGSLAEGIPRATAVGELAYCERLTQGLKKLAPQVRFSWSRQAAEVPHGISPLLADLPQLEEQSPDKAALHAVVNPESVKLKGYRDHPWLTAVEDKQGQPLDQSPGEEIPGGSGMISAQSDCPMLAYFSYRLRAGFEDMPGPFADAAFRGSLVHTAMQALFAEQAGIPWSATR